jgi:trimethyllysine dioxygenase
MVAPPLMESERRMCGAYIGMDEYKSKLAVLTEKFAPDLILHITGEAGADGRSIWSQGL